MTPADFFRANLENARRVSARTGIDPRLVLAQTALETGYGKSAPNNNLFGIKGQGSTQRTKEFRNGQMQSESANFRSYEDPAQSFDDYADLMLGSERYAKVLGAKGLENQISAMAKSGYATDPNYGQKLMSIASGIDLNSAGTIADDTMRALGKSPKGILAPTQTSETETKPMMNQQKPRGLLENIGIQKMQEGAEGETGQRFYNRDSFKDTAATLAQGFGRMGIMGMEEIADQVAGQRTEAKARNKTAEYLNKYMPGAGDLVRDGYMTPKDAIAVSRDEESRNLAMQAAAALRSGNNQEAIAILTQLSPTAMGQQLSSQMRGRKSEVGGGGKYSITYPDGPNAAPKITLNEDVIAAEQRIKAAEKRKAPLPTDARKSEESDFVAIESYDNLIQDIGGIIKDFGYKPESGEFTGPLDIGLGGFIRGAFGAVGLGSENIATAKARQEFDRFRTRLVNESLRLNKGVQTEGDAQRSAKELGDAKTEATAYAAVQELLVINERARANKVAAIERRRNRFGVSGIEIPEAPVSANTGWKIIK